MKYFIILSEGAYSDYSPDYYMGEIEITQGELNDKAMEIGTKLEDWRKSLPLREVTDWSGNLCDEPYDPKTGEGIYSWSLKTKWFIKMREWLFSKGYQELPSNIPEINVYYDIPSKYNPIQQEGGKDE